MPVTVYMPSEEMMPDRCRSRLAHLSRGKPERHVAPQRSRISQCETIHPATPGFWRSTREAGLFIPLAGQPPPAAALVDLPPLVAAC